MLDNTGYKLTKEKKLTIGYFGGSITEGAGASGDELCYRGRVTAWFRERYPEAEITPIQAAIGGTGTDLGMYRCDRDLNDKDPDLVFFEYAVNDSGMAYYNVVAQTETIFRKIRKKNPFADIIVIFTVTGAIHNVLAAGGEYQSRSAQQAVARHYGIPTIDVGEVLRTRTLLEGGDFTRFTTDTVHPNNEGYAIYTDCITGWLEKNLQPGNGLTAYPELPLYSAVVYDDARLEDCLALTDMTADGFRTVEASLCGRYPHYLEATEPGAKLTFTFTGENLGFYWMLAKDSGDVTVQVDGGEPVSMRSWDHYCKSFNRAGAAFAARYLPHGNHTVTITVAETKAEESEGTAIRIGAVLVS
ncbi:MAG: SGNH/GDSL hydrolase family protein [Ruminococcaceae bacterium]|nr:SGNH/GDSL hydrolase family protein [Oscillospiraceae bacterium]